MTSPDRLDVDGRTYGIHRIGAIPGAVRMPYTLRILLENVVRHVAAGRVDEAAIAAVVDRSSEVEVPFHAGRVLMQDFTGVPVVADLAAVRDAVAGAGVDATAADASVPADLVIDHSVSVDVAGRPDALTRNVALEFERNRERYAFLRWGQSAFSGLTVVPPATGIVHQVNLEHLATVVAVDDDGLAHPDTLVGTDSHTTMINGLGVLGWGVGGIEAEAALLGEAIGLPVPRVVGVELVGRLPEGATATDLVLTVTERLREHGVVGKFVEFHGDGLDDLALATRATLANMSPEFGSTCAFFPIDGETLRYLELTGRDHQRIALVEAYAKEQGLWRRAEEVPTYDERLAIVLDEVEPSISGPSRPQDRIAVSDADRSFRTALRLERDEREALRTATVAPPDGDAYELSEGAVVIAAITSCTNTSNPELMLTAGLLARNAADRGLDRAPWVKTSLAPGSRVVIDYYERAGLVEPLSALGFDTVGFGCTTCIGNSGPLAPEIQAAIDEHDLSVAAVLSGNRNFAGRIHPAVRMNYLASPPLVVAYAIAGTVDIDLTSDPLGTDDRGRPVHLADIWPTPTEVAKVMAEAVDPDLFRRRYAEVTHGDERWRELEVLSGDHYAWDPASTYVRRPPFLDDVPLEPPPSRDIEGARALLVLGDSITTDHISPAGAIAPTSPAGRWLVEHGVSVPEFNTYGARRGNHEVMVRGTFANVRIRNRLVGDVEGGFTRHLPGDEVLSVYDAAVRYAEEGVPLIVLAGEDYGAGSSRDWAAKGTQLLGVRAVIAESYERIHRSNLIGMGVAPLQFADGESVDTLGLTGEETFDIVDLDGGPGGTVTVRTDGVEFRARVRIDTASEAELYRHGGILPAVYRRLLAAD